MFALLSAFEVLHPFLLGVMANYVPVTRVNSWLEANIASLLGAWNRCHGSLGKFRCSPGQTRNSQEGRRTKDKLLLLATNELTDRTRTTQ
jgi:hypothetical protein